MSLIRTDYLMLAINISDIEFDMYDEKYTPYVDGHKNVEFSIVKDCNGEFCYFGIVLKKSDDNGFDRTPVNVLFNSWMVSQLRRNIYLTCNDLFNCEFDKKHVNIYLVTEYT
jgi:hypothetical protein